MLKILWKRGEIAPVEQFLLLSTIFCHLMLDFCVKTRIRFSLRDKRLFEITEVKITRVGCILAVAELLQFRQEITSPFLIVNSAVCLFGTSRVKKICTAI